MATHSVTGPGSRVSGDPSEMSSRRFVLALLACMLASAVTIGVFNLLVDPHGLSRWIEIPGFNVLKPRASQSGEAFKYRAVTLLKPSTLLVGNSRVEMGWDPSTLSATRFGVTVNVALPGKGLDGLRPLLDHAWNASKPRDLLVGVDFMDCLSSRGAARSLSKDVASPPKSPWADQSGGPLDSLRTHSRRLLAFLSLDTTLDSIVTVASQHRAGTAHLRADGFNPASDYESTVRIDGPRKMFVQRETEVIKTRFARQPSIRAADGSLSPCFGEIDALLRDARARRQSVMIATYPYHARLLEILWQTNVWRDYEDWKRELTVMVERARAQGLQVVARDFSGYHVYATERLVDRADSRTPLRWYWEAGHFKSALGDRMLSIMTGLAPSEGTFGAELATASIEGNLAAIRVERDQYTSTHPDVQEAIRRLIKSTSP